MGIYADEETHKSLGLLAGGLSITAWLTIQWRKNRRRANQLFPPISSFFCICPIAHRWPRLAEEADDWEKID